ncbi:MAG: GNAT family N-acetyltransferase [Aureliella sp.]
MAVAYFKRYRMELQIDRSRPIGADLPRPPQGFRVLPWTPRLLNQHADVKWMSFREELDAHVFPCLSQREGCRHLMREIVGRTDFVPEATWLVVRENSFTNQWQPCGTIQGLLSGSREGAIQNIGVHPECRGLGLGTVLVAYAVDGFKEVDCQSVNLEVTVENSSAIRLYERLGFRRVETLFKISETQIA